MSPVIRLASFFVLSLMLLATGLGASAESTVAPLEAVWLSPGVAYPVPRVEVSVDAPEAVPCSTPLRLECAIRTQAAYPFTVVRASVLDEDGQVFREGETVLDLVPGSNSCTIEWDTSSLPVGEYMVVVDVDHATNAARARYEIPMSRVSSADLRDRLAEVTQACNELEEGLAIADDAASVSPYASIRLRIVETFLDRARADQAEGRWSAMYGRLQYIERTLPSVAAWLAFGDTAPELRTATNRPLPGKLHREGGSFVGQNGPVYLFGSTVRDGSVDDVARLERFGFNLAGVTIPPRVTLPAPGRTASLADTYGHLFQALEDGGLAAVVSLEPADLPAWLHEQYPDVTDKGFVDLAHVGLRPPLRQHIQSVMPYLAGRENVLGVSLVSMPQFRFDSEATRLDFVERVRAIYPDRQLLNRTWEAHLGDYEDIGIWGNYPGYAHLDLIDVGKDWRYQTNNAYQFDWQSFHRERAAAFMGQMMEDARAVEESIPLGFEVSERVFELEETRTGVDREAISRLTDLSMCSGECRPDDRFYGMRYPMPFALYTLLRSYAPQSPVLNLDAELFEANAPLQAHHGDYVRSVVWESVMAGLSGMTIPADSALFAYPETLEGYATAALDVNRLAGLVQAFQQAPARVGVLFSASSAIYRDGDPHSASALDAFEGASFAGYAVRFISEAQCTPETLAGLHVVVVPETPALSGPAFDALSEYVDNDGVTVRVGTPIPYTERGASRSDVLSTTGKTVLVRGLNLPTEYLHAMDAAIALGSLPAVVRTVNSEGYPLEGVRTRCVEFDGETYLYVLNLRKDPVVCHLTGNAKEGRDLIRGRTVRFPLPVAPLDPMLIRLKQPTFRLEMAEAGGR